MRFKVTRWDQLDRIPKPCVAGSNPAGSAKKTTLTWSFELARTEDDRNRRLKDGPFSA